MINNQTKHVFNAVQTLYGIDNLTKIQNANVAVIGVGGVGSWVAEALVRSGLRYISIFDLDEVCVTNINRQSMALYSTIGLPKVNALQAKLIDINPNATIKPIADFVDAQNVQTYICNQFTIVIDCIDNALVKASIVAHCIQQNIHIITIGAAGGKINPALISIDDLSKVQNDKLLAKVRNNLRSKYKIGETINTGKNIKAPKFHVQAVYSTEQMRVAQSCYIDKQKCDIVYGSSVMVTTTFAMYAAAYALQYIMKCNSLS